MKITINIKDKEKALAFLNFIKTLDFVTIVEVKDMESYIDSIDGEIPVVEEPVQITQKDESIKDEDWWNELDEFTKSEVIENIRHAENGQLTSDKDARKRIKEFFKEYE